MEKVKDNNLLNNIKSIYILKQIFGNIKQKKLLYLIRYNKNIQNILKIGINDYIEFIKIEIEIFPICKNERNYFINRKEQYESYYHIYFNDDKNEINRIYFTRDDNIKKIKIVIDKEVKSFEKLFYSYGWYDNCIEKINFIKFNRTDINNMSYMFSRSSLLREINFYSFNTDNVDNMSCMFNGCSSLKRLDLSNFNTNNVTNMNSMFRACESLKELNINNFSFNKVKYMFNIFYACSDELEIKIKNTIKNIENFLKN